MSVTLSKSKRKHSEIHVRFSSEDRKAFIQAAHGAHLNLSSWIRSRLWSAARRENAKNGSAPGAEGDKP
jgi:hypothetical protein